MGLDVVEIVMRCEEELGVGLDSQLLESIDTVGELFEIICAQMNLPPGSDSLQPVNRSSIHHAIAVSDEWTRETVWLALVRMCADQLQVEPDKITYTARFVDLGAD